MAVRYLYLSFYTYCRSVSFPTLPLPLLPLHINTRKKNNTLIQILRTNRHRLRVKILPLPFTRSRYCSEAGEEGKEGDGKEEEGPEAGKAFRGGVSFYVYFIRFCT